MPVIACALLGACGNEVTPVSSGGAPAPTGAPSVPSGLAASAITSSGLALGWTASTPAAGASIAGYIVYRDGARLASPSSTGYVDSGLKAATSYSYQVAAFDNASPANVSALSAPLSVTTAAPTWTPPAGLIASNVTAQSLSLSWTAASELGGSVAGYDVYRNGVQIGTATGSSYADTNLAPSTNYSYQVAAFDAATPPNTSALSAALAVTTAAAGPGVPTGLTASAVTSSSATLSWSAASDSGGPGIAGYEVFRNGAQIASVSGATSYVDSGLSAATNYNYQVASVDASTPPQVSALSAALSVPTAGGVSFALSPRSAALTLSQSQQFSNNAPLGTVLSWSVDGVAGGNSSIGTISSSGLYTPPAVAGTHSVTASSLGNAVYTASAAIAVTDLGGITTYHGDLARTGQNLREYALTPATVASAQFGKRWSCPVDGSIYAQPLYVANLAIAGGTHNVLFVATMHDSLYAFDADNPGCVVYWQQSFINAAAGVTTQSSAQIGCLDVQVEYGILGTPVIDPVAQTIYLVANTTESGHFVQRLHALNLATGAEQTGSPVLIAPSSAGSGDGGTSDTFQAGQENQRPGLLLTDGGVFIGWSAHCDNGPWHGWFVRYDATTLAQTAVFNVTPNGSGGGIWMSAGAPAVDASGNIYLSTGNGSFDDTADVVPPALTGEDFGMSVLNLNPASLSVQDYFTPYEWSAWSGDDYDISAAGVTVLPDGSGPSAHPNLLLAGDKQGHLYLLDRSHMSQFNPSANNVVQLLALPNSNACDASNHECLYSSAAYWNGIVYVSVNSGPVMAFPLAGGLLPSSNGQAVAASQSAENYGFPAPTPTISASPAGGAILWVLDNSKCGTDDCGAAAGNATLRAYDASNLATELYSSATSAADAAGKAIKFSSPVVANGHVYVNGDGVFSVYAVAP
jgi:chitodextrinase